MLFVANWKTYVGDIAAAKKLFSTAKRLSRRRKISVVLAPPAPFLGLLAQGKPNHSGVTFAAQDISLDSGRPATGTVTARAHRASGATYTLIGHSEVRARGETNGLVLQKMSQALAQGLTPILCIGESERDPSGKYLSIIREQLTSALDLTPAPRKPLIIAYEPVWAIGKTAGEAIAPGDLGEMILYIRKVLAELLPAKHARDCRVLYGGSVEPENARSLARTSGVDGFLVGHASVDPGQFAALIEELS